MEESATWAAIWLAAAAGFGMGEILIAGSFFLLPFAAGALVASVVSLFGLHVLVSWLVFVLVSGASFFGMRPLARRLDAKAPEVAGIGANRLLGSSGIVLSPISATPGDAGLVKVGTEEWRADTPDGVTLSAGTRVRVIEVQGTRLLVEPAEVDDVDL
jgi:membrane protein implicated in regulation of membrane protease activity